MTPRTCRRLILAGTAMFAWSACMLMAMHGGLLLSEVTR
jgi:hypothetical protein